MPNAIWYGFGGAVNLNDAATVANNCINGKIEYVIPLVGEWNSNGTINYGSPTAAQWKTWTNAIQVRGVKVLACVGGSASPPIDISSASIRTAMVNSIVGAVNTIGADGYHDDTEVCHNGIGTCADADLLLLWNAFDDALRPLGKISSACQYYRTGTHNACKGAHLSFWAPICYNATGAAPATCITNAVANSLSPCVAGIGQYQEPLTNIMSSIDSMSSATKTRMAGICIFWYGSMSSSDWTNWNNWKTKDNYAGTSPNLAILAISPISASINVDGKQQLTSICKDQNGNTMTCPTLTWNGSNSSIATVNSSGLVTGISAGTANITASTGGKTSNISTITVITTPTGSKFNVYQLGQDGVTVVKSVNGSQTADQASLAVANILKTL
jgi:hypothetical protein